MNLKTQKRISAQILKVGVNKIKFDPDKLDDIKEAITKTDIRSLIKRKVIIKRPVNYQSRARARMIKRQKSKGNRKGPGSREGTKKARANTKTLWVRKIRLLRGFLRALKKNDMLDNKIYRELILKSKGGFFRSRRHLKLYLNEHKIIKPKIAKSK